MDNKRPMVQELKFKTLFFDNCRGDRLEKLGQVECLIKDATEDWNSIQKAFKDAYPCEGCVFSGIEEELTTTRVPLGTLREMEKEWMNVVQSRKTKWLTLE